MFSLWCYAVPTLTSRAVAYVRCVQAEEKRAAEASEAWGPMAIALAFMRANRTHRFRELVLRPDVLPVIAAMARTDYSELNELMCAQRHLHGDGRCDWRLGVLKEERTSVTALTAKVSAAMDSHF